MKPESVRKPRLTALVMSGLAAALVDRECMMAADDSCVTAEDQREHDAADKWHRGMVEWRAAHRTPAQHDEKGGDQ